MRSIFLLTLFGSFSTVVVAFRPSECSKKALGMESGSIADSQLLASSSFDAISVGPQNGRIRTEKASGAWCPKPQIREGSYEFLQVNLGKVYVITAVETQGRYGNGTGKEFTTEYMLDYLRPGSQWMRYRSRNGSNVIQGNEDTINSAFREIDPPIVASRIRFVPYSNHARTMCLRVELYGCEHQEGLMFYSMNFNGSRIGEVDMRDKIFEDSGLPSPYVGINKGLGLLSDGIVAQHNKPIEGGRAASDSTWIGWSHMITNGSVELIFEFDQVRNFSFVELFAFGRPFQLIQIAFSNDGKNFPLASQISSTMNPRGGDSAQQAHFTLKVPMHNRPGLFVKMTLTSSDAWIFLTEVSFISRIRSSWIRATILPDSSNTTVYDPPSQMNTVVTGIMFTGLVIIFVFLTCVICAILLAKRTRIAKMHPHSKERVMVTSMDRNGVSTNVLIAQSSPSSLLHPPHETVEDSHKYNSSSTDSGKPRSPSWSNFHFPPPPPVDDDSHPSTPLLNTASGRRPNVPSRRKTSVDMQYSPRKYTDDSLFYAASNIALSNSSDRNVLPKVNKEAVIMGDILGEGRFTAVHICKVGGCKMAAKVLKGNNPQAESAISDEINILSSLNHPNIVKVLGISEDRRLFMEFVLHRDIRYFLQHVEEDISQKVLLSICSEVAAAMKYLEEQNVIHGHLSPKCVLIGNNLCVKICSPRGKGHHAQLRYSAPESIIANDWTSKSDVWSFAVTVWEILNHCRLRAYDDFSNGDLLENAHRIIAGTQAVYLDFGYSLPEKLAQHLMECWRQKPSERPTFSALHFLLSSSETHSISRNRDANFYASVA